MWISNKEHLFSEITICDIIILWYNSEIFVLQPNINLNGANIVTYTFNDIMKIATSHQIERCEVTNHPVLGTTSFTPTIPPFPTNSNECLRIGVPHSEMPDKVGSVFDKRYDRPPKNDSVHYGTSVLITKKEVKSVFSESDYIHTVITQGEDNDIIFRITFQKL